MANFSNPRKKFQWRISFASLKGNEFEFQRVTLPDIELDVVEHGEINSPGENTRYGTLLQLGLREAETQ